MSRTGAAVRAIASRPRLWATAIHQARTLAPSGWWRRRPFLPVPDRQWMAFRLTTAYGDPAAEIDADDLVVWMEWSRRRRRGRVDAAPTSPGRPKTPGHRARRHG